MTKKDLINSIKESLKHWLLCKQSYGEFKEGEYYWIELLESGKFYGRSDNVKDKILNLPVGILQQNFIVTDKLV